MNKLLSISPSMDDKIQSRSPIVTVETPKIDFSNDKIIKKSNLKDKVKQSFKINTIKKSVKIVETMTERDNNEK